MIEPLARVRFPIDEPVAALNVPEAVILPVTVCAPLASVPERVEAPSTDNVPATAVLPDALATVNLSVLTSKFPSIPVAPCRLI